MRHEFKVVAKTNIPSGTNLGFYGGFYSVDDCGGGCSWKLKGGGYLNGREMLSGFLRYINSPADSRQHANTLCRHMTEAFAVHETVYYVTFKRIKMGADVLISYGKDSGRVKEYFAAELAVTKTNNKNVKALRRAAIAARRKPTGREIKLMDIHEALDPEGGNPTADVQRLLLLTEHPPLVPNPESEYTPSSESDESGDYAYTYESE